MPPLLIHERHPDQPRDEEEGGREDRQALGAGAGGDEAEDEGAQQVGALARETPEAKELATLLRRREELHETPGSGLERADPQARSEGDPPEEPFRVAEVRAHADQD